MIVDFKDKDTRQFFEGERIARFHAFTIQATRRLTILDSAANLNDLAVLKSNHLELLERERKGQYSIRINAQWRICFRWTDEGPCDVEIVDYH